ncbi:crossover junction endodeoxyribonuclease RuvC [Brevibacillus sp. NPDC058079]|uniref:crossover junction endodeoxyribonuclease RuvC n=1 Tax=Brevibacillus sp. NPDC058079 TaxID=3346330 RepID=UPI0036E4D52B
MAVIVVMNETRKSIIGIGIDQGIADCGFSVVKLTEHGELIVLKSGIIKTSSESPLPQRMTLLYSLLMDLVETYKPDIIGCEKLFFNPRQKASSDGKKGRNKSASIVMTNMATGIINLIAGRKQVQLQEFVPGTVKKYVAGSGRADKDAVIAAVRHLLQRENLKEHEADATAIGITAVKFYRDMQGQMPAKKSKKRKMKGVKE